MRKTRLLLLLPITALLLLIGGCASAPEGDERVSAPEPSLQSKPEKRIEEPLLLEDSAAGAESQDVVPSAEMLRQKSEKQSDDMERLD